MQLNRSLAATRQRSGESPCVTVHRRPLRHIYSSVSNPNVSEEAKEHSRQVLEEIEGTSDRDAFVASTGTEKSSNYNAEHAANVAGHVSLPTSTNCSRLRPSLVVIGETDIAELLSSA